MVERGIGKGAMKKRPKQLVLVGTAGHGGRRRGAGRPVLAAKPRPDFQVVHHSVQRDHVHLLVEASDARVLSSALRSLEIRFAKRLNALLGRRKGKVWGDRYHRRELAAPREVRSALLYVLQNAKKHGEARADASFVDPFSSAEWFDGWKDRRARDGPEDGSWRPPRPRTWLLAVGWRRRGLLLTTEAPKRGRPR